MKPVIANDRRSCTIGSETLQLSQSIDFKSATEQRVGVGKILDFKYAGYNQSDKDSAWMLVRDVVEETEEWISLNVWLEHREKGLFGVTKKTEVVSNDKSSESDNTDDLPF